MRVQPTMETCICISSASAASLGCFTNLPFVFNTATSYSCHRFSSRHRRPTAVVFSVYREEDEKLPAIKSSKIRHCAANGQKFKSKPDLSKKSTPNDNSFLVAGASASRSPCLAATVCHAVDDFISDFMEIKPLKPWLDPRFVLAGNFNPVEETESMKCAKAEGTLPACLNGVYIRNGPNPRYVPRGAHHMFEGDGMLHALRIKNGRATLCSRFVRTNRFVQGDMAGGPVVSNLFSGFSSLGAGLARVVVFAARVALGLFDPCKGVGTANTSVLYFNHKLMALEDSDLPYVVKVTKDGDIDTVGRYDFKGKLMMCMTAHPKIDPDTGELFAFRIGPIAPFLNYFRVSPTGEKEQDVGIHSMPQLSLIHDFAITKQYAIFPDTQLLIKPMNFIVGGSPISCDTAKVPRLGVIPRYATDESTMKWFNVPGFNFLHSLNAWDEGEDEIVLIAANLCPVEHALERSHLVHCSVEKVRLNLRTGLVSRKPLSSKCLEIGVINRRYVAKKNRYAYMSMVASDMSEDRAITLNLCGVAKLDFDMVEECVVASRLYGHGCFGSEPFFVPRTQDLNAEEDDGYIVAFTHNESTQISSFVVMDAQSPTLEIVASLQLPARVPYGFHGLFVSDRDIETQN